MAGGRPKKIVKRTNTSISLSEDDMEFLKSFGKENSAVIRELIAEKRKSMESPIGKIRQEIEERKKHVEDELLLIQMRENRLVEEEENAEKEQREKACIDENRRKMKDFIISRYEFIKSHRSPREFLEYLCKTYDLKDNHEAKMSILDTLIEAGYSETGLKKIPMLK